MESVGQLSFCVERVIGNAVIKIRDTGKGMTKEQLNRLGEPYFFY